VALIKLSRSPCLNVEPGLLGYRYGTADVEFIPVAPIKKYESINDNCLMCMLSQNSWVYHTSRITALAWNPSGEVSLTDSDGAVIVPAYVCVCYESVLRTW
jgi:hypothetical protein